MNVSLTPELDRLVKKKVASGMYHLHDDLQQQKLELLKSEISKGVNSLNAGKGVEMTDDLFEGIKQRGREALKDQVNE